MSGVESNPVVPQESKSAKKKKAKAEAAVKDTTTQPNVISENAKFNAEIMANGADGAYESPYMRELYKYVLGTDDSHTSISAPNCEAGAFVVSRRSW